MKSNPIRMDELDTSRAEFDASVHFVEAGRRYPLHWHDYFELEVVLSGKGIHVCNGRRYEVEAGDAWLMSFYDFHSFEALCDTEIINVSFARDVLPVELGEFLSSGGFQGGFLGDALEEVRQTSGMLLRESKREDELSSVSCRALIAYLTVAVLRASKEEMHRMGAPSIRSAVAYMHEHFREDFSLAEVARAQGLTPNYFGNLFFSTMGVSFREYLNKIRLRHACDLLASSTMSVNEIAHASGYSSVEYFFGVFKKQLSVTPLQYRREMERNK